jgi:hypothetical protein
MRAARWKNFSRLVDVCSAQLAIMPKKLQGAVGQFRSDQLTCFRVQRAIDANRAALRFH